VDLAAADGEDGAGVDTVRALWAILVSWLAYVFRRREDRDG
jgi:hypothetical protein